MRTLRRGAGEGEQLAAAARRRTARQGRGQQQARERARGESEEMRREIDLRAAGSEHRQDAEASCQNCPPRVRAVGIAELERH